MDESLRRPGYVEIILSSLIILLFSLLSLFFIDAAVNETSSGMIVAFFIFPLLIIGSALMAIVLLRSLALRIYGSKVKRELYIQLIICVTILINILGVYIFLHFNLEDKMPLMGYLMFALVFALPCTIFALAVANIRSSYRNLISKK